MGMSIRHQTPVHQRPRLPNRKIIEFLTGEIRHLTGSAARPKRGEFSGFPLETEDVDLLLAALAPQKPAFYTSLLDRAA